MPEDAVPGWSVVADFTPDGEIYAIEIVPFACSDGGLRNFMFEGLGDLYPCCHRLGCWDKFLSQQAHGWRGWLSFDERGKLCGSEHRPHMLSHFPSLK